MYYTVTLICVFGCCLWLSDVDTVSLEFEAPPEALQASHLRMRPVKVQQQQQQRRRRCKGNGDEFSICT